MSINLFYHFSRINDSLLKEDIIGFPLTEQIPALKITPHEHSLFKYNL
jgi:hypothetical protein